MKERKAIKRTSSPERWEIKQMAAAGAISNCDLPEFNDETGLLANDDEGSGMNIVYHLVDLFSV